MVIGFSKFEPLIFLLFAITYKLYQLNTLILHRHDMELDCTQISNKFLGSVQYSRARETSPFSASADLADSQRSVPRITMAPGDI